MNRIIKNIGIAIIFIAIIILAIVRVLDINNNLYLGISFILLVAGLISYILLQKTA